MGLPATAALAMKAEPQWWRCSGATRSGPRLRRLRQRRSRPMPGRYRPDDGAPGRTRAPSGRPHPPPSRARSGRPPCSRASSATAPLTVRPVHRALRPERSRHVERAGELNASPGTVIVPIIGQQPPGSLPVSSALHHPPCRIVLSCPGLLPPPPLSGPFKQSRNRAARPPWTGGPPPPDSRGSLRRPTCPRLDRRTTQKNTPQTDRALTQPHHECSEYAHYWTVIDTRPTPPRRAANRPPQRRSHTEIKRIADGDSTRWNERSGRLIVRRQMPQELLSGEAGFPSGPQISCPTMRRLTT